MDARDNAANVRGAREWSQLPLAFRNGRPITGTSRLPEEEIEDQSMSPGARARLTTSARL